MRTPVSLSWGTEEGKSTKPKTWRLVWAIQGQHTKQNLILHIYVYVCKIYKIYAHICVWMYVHMYAYTCIYCIHLIYSLSCHYSKISFRTSPMRKNTKGYFYYTNIFQS